MNADTFGEWLKARRKKLDLTQEMLAQRVGCSLSAIRKIESDERRPSHQIAELLALHLDVSPEERALFLKIARGESSVQRLSSASPSTEQLVAVSKTLSPPSNIPAATSPFVGRQQECESLTNMLTDPRQRLITILGPGGIGKTRLAMEVATAQLSTFDEQIYFIQLAAYNTADSVLPAIASVFNLPSSSADELKNRLSDYLRDKKVLIVLDNFEHLMDGALHISELLQKTPSLNILVTSRERLNLQGEWTFELSGLSVPPNADEGKAVYSALQLFELHAQRIRPDMKLVGTEREAAIRICQRVDGMPLAIELAAAWVNVLSCEEIANEIERGFDFLTSTLRDVPERHRSLRAVFEHSWRRLTEQEQGALSGLSIFQGGFRLGAAEAILSVEKSVLSSLESKSLVRRQPDGRFDLHETIRQYAHTYLKNEAALLEAHSRFFLELLYQREDTPFGSEGDLERIHDIRAEYGNLQLAWRYAITHRTYDAIDRVLVSSWLIYAIHGWFKEGMDIAFELIDSIRGRAKTRNEKNLLARAIMSALGHLARVGDFEHAEQLSGEATELLRDTGSIEHLSNVLLSHARIVSVMGRYQQAHVLINEGVELAAQLENRWLLGLAYVSHGDIYAIEGNYARACELIKAGLSIYEELGNVHSMVAFALNKLGLVLIQLERLDEAEKVLRESLELNLQLRDRWGQGVSLGRLGILALHQGEIENARTLLKKGLSLFNELGMRWDTAWALMYLGKVSIASNKLPEAERLLKRSIKLLLEAHAMPQAIDTALELAECFIHKNEFNDAAALVFSAIVHPACTNAGNKRAGELRAVIEQNIDVTGANDDTIETVIARLI